MAGVKSAGFQSQLEASLASSHTNELWYNETVRLRMTVYIYLYIYQPIRTNSMQHKVNYLVEFNRFEFRVFFLLSGYHNASYTHTHTHTYIYIYIYGHSNPSLNLK